MIQKFVGKFMEKRKTLFTEEHPDYVEIVRKTMEIITDDNGPDPERITVIDHGDYQGTILFVIAAKGYQPSDFWSVAVSYGSCSECDTLQGIMAISFEDKPTPEQAEQYQELALHIVQQLKEI